MSNPDLYQLWLQRRRLPKTTPEIVDSVMDRVFAEHEAKLCSTARHPSVDRVLEWISLRPVAQAAVLALGFAVGLLRLFATLQFLLS